MSNARGLHFIGKLDRKEEALILNKQQEEAVVRRLLEGRNPKLVQELYGVKRVRDVWDPETRGQSGKNFVMPFYDR